MELNEGYIKTVSRLANSDDYKTGKYWSTPFAKDQEIYELVSVSSGRKYGFRKCKTEKKGRYLVPIKGKYENTTVLIANYDYRTELTLYNHAEDRFIALMPFREEMAISALQSSDERFPEWKKGAIILAVYGWNSRINRFFEITERKGLTVFFKERNRKIVKDDGYGQNGEETLGDGFISSKLYKARILNGIGNKGAIKAGMGDYGYIWDGKQVPFYTD